MGEVLDAQLTAQTVWRAGIPPHYPTGALDPQIAIIRQFLQRPRWRFPHLTRMNSCWPYWRGDRLVDRADPGAAEPAVGAGTFWAVPQARGAPRLSFGGAAGSPEVGPRQERAET
jgi:hypothetical protein